MRILYVMTTITVSPERLHIRLSRFEKFAGLLRDLDVPLSAVRSAAAAPDGLAAARGVRAPGLGLPGYRKVGTWRGRDGKTLVAVRRGQPALVLELSGARYARVVVGSDQPQEYVDRLKALGK